MLHAWYKCNSCWHYAYVFLCGLHCSGYFSNAQAFDKSQHAVIYEMHKTLLHLMGHLRTLTTQQVLFTVRESSARLMHDDVVKFSVMWMDVFSVSVCVQTASLPWKQVGSCPGLFLDLSQSKHDLFPLGGDFVKVLEKHCLENFSSVAYVVNMPSTLDVSPKCLKCLKCVTHIFTVYLK